MEKHIVATIDDIPPGSRKIVTVKGQEMGIFNIKGNYYALLNRCPHQGAPVCLGEISVARLPSGPNEHRRGREGEILRCPRHGWEFELATGRSLCAPQIRMERFTVATEGSDIIIYL